MFNYFNPTTPSVGIISICISNSTSTISKVSSDSVMQLFNRMLQKNSGISKKIYITRLHMLGKHKSIPIGDSTIEDKWVFS